MTTSSHAASLHLFEIMIGAEDREPIEVLSDVRNVLVHLKIDTHLEVDLITNELIEAGSMRLDFKPRTDMGKQILSELRSRQNLPPCPSGDCEPGTTGFCKWCGRRSTG